MSTHETQLSQQDKELVALGASVGAGCHPCLAHHLKAAKQADLTEARTRTAITSAQLVAAQAAEELALSVQRRLDVQNVTPPAPAAVEPHDTELAALGAALGANDRLNIERHLTAAAALGVTPSQLRAAQHWLDKMAPEQGSTIPESAEPEGGCGCHSEPDAEAAQPIDRR